MAGFPVITKPASDSTSALLSKTSNEVSYILKNQLETFRRLEEIQNYFSTAINVSKEAAQVSQILHVVISLSDASAELHNISGGIQRVEKKLEGTVFSPSHWSTPHVRSYLQITIESKRTRLRSRSVKRSCSGCPPSSIKRSITMYVRVDFRTLGSGFWIGKSFGVGVITQSQTMYYGVMVFQALERRYSRL